MTDKGPTRPQFQNFPRLRNIPKSETGAPSVFDTSNNNYKRFNKFEAKNIKRDKFDIWVRRNPRTFQVLGLTIGLSIYYSRFIYDLVFANPPNYETPKLD